MVGAQAAWAPGKPAEVQSPWWAGRARMDRQLERHALRAAGYGVQARKGEADLTLHPGAASRPPAKLPCRSPDTPSVLWQHPRPPGFVTEPWAAFPEAGQEPGLLTHLLPPAQAGPGEKNEPPIPLSRKRAHPPGLAGILGSGSLSTCSPPTISHHLSFSRVRWGWWGWWGSSLLSSSTLRPRLGFRPGRNFSPWVQKNTFCVQAETSLVQGMSREHFQRVT